MRHSEQILPVAADTARELAELAARYETREFIVGDPSWFMHQVEGDRNRELTAFVASCLSYGARRQFMPKVEWLVDRAEGDIDAWVRSGTFARDLPADSDVCFYRMNTVAQLHCLLAACRDVLDRHGSLSEYLRGRGVTSGIEAVNAITARFASRGVGALVPKDATSACKRVCMFLRWMARADSPVDLGLWADFLDRRTLIMPMDTHVVQQSLRLGLLTCNAKSPSVTMRTAQRLTDTLRQVFPDDPLRADFALFGYGVTAASRKHERCQALRGGGVKRSKTLTRPEASNCISPR